jgi:hypothetical protein
VFFVAIYLHDFNKPEVQIKITVYAHSIQ